MILPTYVNQPIAKIPMIVRIGDRKNPRFLGFLRHMRTRLTPEIPPLLENDVFVLDFASKAQIFNDYFILQCTTLDTGSDMPHDLPTNCSQLAEFSISDEKILTIIRNLNPNKAHGWDKISGRMIKMCDTSLVKPLKLIF